MNTPQWMTDWYEASLKQFYSNQALTIEPFNALSESDIPQLSDIPPPKEVIPVGIIKLNGGLGTSMGCSYAKSLIACTDNGQTFLDILIQQANHHHQPLILLNSFHTHADTTNHIKKNHPSFDYRYAIQHPFRRINATTRIPIAPSDAMAHSPPGHGSIYYDLYYNQILHQLLNQGIDYIFISNADNLAATYTPSIPWYMHTQNIPFLIELTAKREIDKKGGTLVQTDHGLRLLEVAQVPDTHLTTFMEQPTFNTNNIWVHIPALIQQIESNQLVMNLILNKKKINHTSVIQLEYAMGSAIQSFSNSAALMVPRSRFFPIKKTSDYLLLRSDYTTVQSNGRLSWNLDYSPLITCHPPFDTIQSFHHYFKSIPSLIHCKQLALKGPIFFETSISLKGSIHLSAPNNQPIFLRSNADILPFQL